MFFEIRHLLFGFGRDTYDLKLIARKNIIKYRSNYKNIQYEFFLTR